MLDYQNGKIYTIKYKNDSSLIYVGSTCLSLSLRFRLHKNVCYNSKDKSYYHKFYTKIRETNDIDNWFIELYENYPCENKEQLLLRENAIIKEISTLNVQQGETTYTRKQKVKTLDDLKNKKSYLWKQSNHENVLNYHKNYNEDNKQRIKEIGEQRVTCDCGHITRKDHLKRHMNTAKHSKALKTLTDDEKQQIKENQEKEKLAFKEKKNPIKTSIQYDQNEINEVEAKLNNLNIDELTKLFMKANIL